MIHPEALMTARAILGGPTLPSQADLEVIAQLLADEELGDVARVYIHSHLSRAVGDALSFVQAICKLELERVHISFSVPGINESVAMNVASEDTASLGLTFEIRMGWPEQPEWISTFSDHGDMGHTEAFGEDP